MLNYYEIVKTVFLDPIVVDADGRYTNFHKIEIYKNNRGEYYSRLVSLESFDLIVTAENIVSSSNIYYLDHILTILEETPFQSIDDCLTFALKKIEDVYYSEKSMKEINTKEIDKK